MHLHATVDRSGCEGAVAHPASGMSARQDLDCLVDGSACPDAELMSTDGVDHDLSAAATATAKQLLANLSEPSQVERAPLRWTGADCCAPVLSGCSGKLAENALLEHAQIGGATPLWQWIGDGATVFSY